MGTRIGGRCWTRTLTGECQFQDKERVCQSDSLSKIKADLSQNIAVSEVQYNQELVSSLNNIINEVSLVLLGVAVGISILVIILIDNTIRLAMFPATGSSSRPCRWWGYPLVHCQTQWMSGR